MLRSLVNDDSFSGVVRDDAVPGREVDPEAGSLSVLIVDALTTE